MSFVKKAIKKVVKTVKKIVKSKIFKYVVIAAAIFFTAGVAAGGFAAFSGVSSIGGFFTAVGQTIATGASAIAGGLGFQGASSTLAGYGGAAAEAAGLTASSQILAPVVVNAMTVGTGAGQAATVAAAQTAAGQAAGSGFLASVKGVLGKKVIGDATIGELASKGIMTAVTASLKSKGDEKEYANSFVAGGVARGGGSEAPAPIDYEFGGQQDLALPSAGEQAGAKQGAPVEEPTLAAQMAQGGEAQPSPVSRIQALIQERGPISQPGYGGLAQYAGPARGGLAPQEAAVNPQLLVGQPSGAPPEGRTFTQGASQLQYAPRGLV